MSVTDPTPTETEDRALVLDATDPVETRLATSVRELQDAVRGNLAAPERLEQLAAQIDLVTRELRQAGTHDTMGTLTLGPGRKGGGQTMAPVYDVVESSPERVAGRVVFTRFHLGADGAAHGGALSMWADDILGRLALGLSEHLTRTAFLHLEFRKVVPIGVPSAFAAWLDHREERKRHLRCTLSVEDVVAVEAHGLWLETVPPRN